MYYLSFTAAMAAMPEMPSSRATVAAGHEEKEGRPEAAGRDTCTPEKQTSISGKRSEERTNRTESGGAQAPISEGSSCGAHSCQRENSQQKLGFESNRLSLRPRALRVEHVKQRATAEQEEEKEGEDVVVVAAAHSSQERGKRIAFKNLNSQCSNGAAKASTVLSATSRTSTSSVVGKIRSNVVHSRRGEEDEDQDETEENGGEVTSPWGSATTGHSPSPPPRHQHEQHHDQQLSKEESSPSIRSHLSRSPTRTRTARVAFSSSSPPPTSALPKTVSASLQGGSPVGRLRRIAALQRALLEAEALARRLEKHIETEAKRNNNGEEDNKKKGDNVSSPPPPEGESDDEDDEDDAKNNKKIKTSNKKDLALKVSDALYCREHMYLLTSGVAAFKRKKLESEKLLQEVLMGKTRGLNSGAGPAGGSSSGYYNYTQTARGNRGWLPPSNCVVGQDEAKVGNSTQPHFAGDDPHNTGNVLLAAHRHKIGLDKTSRCALCEMSFPTKAMAATVTYKAVFELQKKWKARWEAQTLELQVEAPSRNRWRGGEGGGKTKVLGEELSSRASSPPFSTPSPSSPTARRRAMSPSSARSTADMRGGGRSRSPPPSPLSAVPSPSSPRPRPLTSSGTMVGWAEQRRASRSQSTTVSQHAKARTLSSSPSVLYDKCFLCRFCAQHVGVYLGESSLVGETHEAEEDSTLAEVTHAEREKGLFSGRVPMSGDSFSFNSTTMLDAKPGEEASEAFSRVLETTYIHLTAENDHGGGERGDEGVTHVYQEEGHPFLFLEGEEEDGARKRAERKVGEYPKRPWTAQVRGTAGTVGERKGNGNGRSTTPSGRRENVNAGTPPRPATAILKRHNQPNGKDAGIPQSQHGMRAHRRDGDVRGDDDAGGRPSRRRSVSPSSTGHPFADEGNEQTKSKGVFFCSEQITRHTFTSLARLREVEARLGKLRDDPFDGEANKKIHLLVSAEHERRRNERNEDGGGIAKVGKKEEATENEKANPHHDDGDDEGSDYFNYDDEKMRENMPFHEWVQFKLRVLPPLELGFISSSDSGGPASPLGSVAAGGAGENDNDPYPLENVPQQQYSQSGDASLLITSQTMSAASVDFNATANTVNNTTCTTSTPSSPTSSSTIRSGRRLGVGDQRVDEDEGRWEKGANKMSNSSSSSLWTKIHREEQEQNEMDNNTKFNENGSYTYEEEEEESETLSRASITMSAAHDTTKAPHGNAAEEERDTKKRSAVGRFVVRSCTSSTCRPHHRGGKEEKCEYTIKGMYDANDHQERGTLSLPREKSHRQHLKAATALTKSKPPTIEDSARIKKTKRQQERDIVALAVKRLTANNKRSPSPSPASAVAAGQGPRRRAGSSKPSLPIPAIVVSRASDASDCFPSATGGTSKERTRMRSATKKTKIRPSSSSTSAASANDSGLDLKNQQQHQQKTKKRQKTPAERTVARPLDTPNGNGKRCSGNATADGVLKALADACGALGVDSDVLGAGLDVGVTNDMTSSTSTPKGRTPAFAASPTNKSPSVSLTADYYEYFAGEEGDEDGDSAVRNASTPTPSRRKRRSNNNNNNNKYEGEMGGQSPRCLADLASGEIEGADDNTNTTTSSCSYTNTYDVHDGDNNDGEAHVRRNSDRQENTKINTCTTNDSDGVSEQEQNNDELASGDVRVEEEEADDASHAPLVGNGLTSVHVEGIEEASGIFLTPPTFDHCVLTMPHYTGNQTTCDDPTNTPTVLAEEERNEFVPLLRGEEAKTEVTGKREKKLTSRAVEGNEMKVERHQTDEKKKSPTAKKKKRFSYDESLTAGAAATSSHQPPPTLINMKAVGNKKEVQKKADSVRNGVKDPKPTAVTSRREEKEYFFHNPQEAPTSKHIVLKQPTPSFTSNSSRSDASKTIKRTEKKGSTRSFLVHVGKEGKVSDKEPGETMTNEQKGVAANSQAGVVTNPRQGKGPTKSRLTERTDGEEELVAAPIHVCIADNEGVTIHVGEVPCGAKRV